MKTIRYSSGDIRVLGFTLLNLVSYGINPKNKYRIEVNLTFGCPKCIPFYQSTKKPWFRNLYVIAALWLPTQLVIIPVAFVGFILWVYFDGARNFIKDKVWVDNVRVFTWMTMALVLILLTLLILK